MRSWSTLLLALMACADVPDGADIAPHAADVEVLSPEEQAARKMAALPIEQQSKAVQQRYREARVRHLDQAIASARATLDELQSQSVRDGLVERTAQVRARLNKLELEKQQFVAGDLVP
jgi:hypothetical protein